MVVAKINVILCALCMHGEMEMDGWIASEQVTYWSAMVIYARCHRYVGGEWGLVVPFPGHVCLLARSLTYHIAGDGSALIGSGGRNANYVPSAEQTTRIIKF